MPAQGNPGGPGTGNPYHDPETGQFTDSPYPVDKQAELANKELENKDGKETEVEIDLKDEEDKKRIEELRKQIDEARLNPEVVNVGGDEWNQKTAERLEREYQAAKPELDKLAAAIEGAQAEFESPKTWDDLSDIGKEEAELSWKNDNIDSYVKDEVNIWHDSGQSKADALGELIYETTNNPTKLADIFDGVVDHPIDATREEFAEDGINIPFSNEQITKAIVVNTEYPGDPSSDLELFIDDAKLGLPEGFDDSPMLTPKITDEAALKEAKRFSKSIGEDWNKVPPADQKRYIEGAREDLQGKPWLEPENPAHRLTTEMRESILSKVKPVIEEYVEKVSWDMEAPEWITDQAKESLDTVWDEMPDSEKWNQVEQFIPKFDEDFAAAGVIKMPDTWDPLEKMRGSEEYRDTQRFMRKLSVERAAQIMVDRKLGEAAPYTIAEARYHAETLDKHLWNDWKGSSQSNAGVLLQEAVAKELGARESRHLNRSMPESYTTNNGDTYDIDAIKAYVRGKWEASQYALDQSGDNTIQVYRALKHIPLTAEAEQAAAKTFKDTGVMVEVPQQSGWPPAGSPRQDLFINRNGAASTSLDASVANGWGTNDRTVLRIEAPRTAVISVPAYGENYHEEREVVIAGTAWKGWDAWYTTAPSFEEVPIGKAYGKSTNELLKVGQVSMDEGPIWPTEQGYEAKDFAQ